MSTDSQTPPKIPLAPRLSIMHFLTFTTGVAIVFGHLEHLRDFIGEIATVTSTYGETPMEMLFTSCSATYLGASLASLYWIFDWRWKKGKFHLQPGHWWLLSNGIIGGLFLPIQWLLLNTFVLNATSMVSFAEWVSFFYLFFQIAAALVLAMGCYYSSGLWRWVLGLLALKELMSHSINAAPTLLTIVYSLTILIVFTVIVVEVVRRIRRDWIHHFGIAMLLLSHCTDILSVNYFFYFNKL